MFVLFVFDHRGVNVFFTVITAGAKSMWEVEFVYLFWFHILLVPVSISTCFDKM